MLEKTNKNLVPNFVTPCYEPPSGVPHLTPAKKNTRYPKRGQGWSATDFAVGVRNSDELLGYEPPSGVPRLTPAHKNKPVIREGQRVYLVGRGGFGPPKSGDDRFTVCSLWPLGNLPIYVELAIGIEPTTC